MYQVLTDLAELSSVRPNERADDAPALAEEFLAGVATRLAHSRGVAARAKRAEWILPLPWRSAISDAAWLHDIGYAGEVASTGCHQLDAARWLAAHGWPMDVCRLVAWHTGAETEARLRGLQADLAADFEAPPTTACAALTWADLTTSPLGAPWTVDRRLADILERQRPDSIVHQATLSARPSLLEAARTVEALLDTEAPAL